MSDLNIRDVARQANVSVATITRVLNSSEMVSEKTREHVLKTIRDLGYVPNRMAGALKSRNTGILGNISLSTEENPYFSMVRESLCASAQTCGYHILTMTTRKQDRQHSHLINELMGWMVEGFIFSGEVVLPPEDIERLLDKNIPIVMIERPMDIPGVDKVIINDREGAGQVADNFLRAGHRHTAFIGVMRQELVELNRYNGYVQGLKKGAATLLEKDQVFISDYTMEDGYLGAKQLFERYREDSAEAMPSAIFASCDILACGVLQYLYERRLHVPEDISIIGYDNTLSTACSPQISSMALPFTEMGKTAFSLFLERKTQNRVSAKCVELSPYFVDRHSVRELRL